MNHQLDDEGLQTIFRGMRDEDERVAPPFARVVGPAEVRVQRTSAFRLLRLTAAGATLVVLCLVGIIVVPRPKDRDADLEQPPAVTTRSSAPEGSQQSGIPMWQWQSPTNFLLRTPGDEILRSVPRLDRSEIEIDAATSDDIS